MNYTREKHAIFQGHLSSTIKRKLPILTFSARWPCFALVHGTKTADYPGEVPDHSANTFAATALPRQEECSAEDTLTYTYVDAEAPRKDERHHRGGRVLPQCS